MEIKETDKIYVNLLKNCPKCRNNMLDGPNEISLYPDTPDWRISCYDCKFTVDAFTLEEAIKEWNSI